jgi:hypothetical protein
LDREWLLFLPGNILRRYPWMSIPAVFSSVSLADQDRLRGAKVETGVAEIALELFLPHRFSID